MSESNPPQRSWIPPVGSGPSSSAEPTATTPVPRPWQPATSHAPIAVEPADTVSADTEPADNEPADNEPAAIGLGAIGPGAEPAPDEGQTAEDATPASTGRARRVLTAGLVVVALALAGTTGYLYRASHAWQDRADRYEAASTGLGSDLAATRQDLDGAQSELDAVRAQLTTAQARIVELANEKAQVGDDREAQRIVADYQVRVSALAGRVALALDQCVKGQEQLIGYLGTPERYDKASLDDQATKVAALCTAATDANGALQTELGQ